MTEGGADRGGRVLFVTNGSATTGGIQRYCHQLASALDEPCELRNVDLRQRGRHRSSGVLMVVKEMILRRPTVVVLSHINLSALGLLAKILGIRFVIVVYGIDVWSTTSRVKTLATQLANEIWSISDFTKSQMHVFYPRASRTRVIGAGVCDEWFSIEHRRGERFRVLTVARLDRLHAKGIDVCVEAMSRLPGDLDIEYVVVGTGAEEPVLRQIAAKQPGRVTVLGEIDDAALAEEYSHASAILLMTPFARGETPIGEGLGLVVLEGAAAGLPAIVARAAGVTETVVEGSTGLIVEPGDVDSLTECLAELAKDPSRAEQLGSNGRRWCRDHFSEPLFLERVSAAVSAVSSPARCGVAETLFAWLRESVLETISRPSRR